MTSTTDPRLVTAAEAARLLGVPRQRVLELATAAADFPPGQPTPTGARVWPRLAVQAWAATHPDPGPVFTGPDLPPDGGHPPQIWAVMNRAASEAQELNHPWIGDDHLVLGMLHPDCPGATRGTPSPATSSSRPPPSSYWSAPTSRRPASPTPRSPASMSCWR